MLQSRCEATREASASMDDNQQRFLGQLHDPLHVSGSEDNLFEAACVGLLLLCGM